MSFGGGFTCLIMKKLKVDHIAPYLPYDLEFYYKNQTLARDVKGIYFTGQIKSSSNPFATYDLKEVKPLFRPINDIGIDFIHKGKTVNAFKESGFHSLAMLKDCLRAKTDVDYKFMLKLLEYKFNIFNVPKSLYINLNKI